MPAARRSSRLTLGRLRSSGRPRGSAPGAAMLVPALLVADLVRIGQVSPLYESVPPQEYGGTERVVSFLTEELVRAGHDVTLFASADSKTSARLIPMRGRPLRLDESRKD